MIQPVNLLVLLYTASALHRANLTPVSRASAARYRASFTSPPSPSPPGEGEIASKCEPEKQREQLFEWVGIPKSTCFKRRVRRDAEGAERSRKGWVMRAKRLVFPDHFRLIPFPLRSLRLCVLCVLIYLRRLPCLERGRSASAARYRASFTSPPVPLSIWRGGDGQAQRVTSGEVSSSGLRISQAMPRMPRRPRRRR
jgi:hypothetical protein